MLSETDGELLSHYLHSIKPGIPTTSENSDVALLNSRGKSLGNYSGLLKTLANVAIYAGASAIGRRKWKSYYEGLKKAIKTPQDNRKSDSFFKLTNDCYKRPESRIWVGFVAD